jgi:hypothetical protein
MSLIDQATAANFSAQRELFDACRQMWWDCCWAKTLLSILAGSSQSKADWAFQRYGMIGACVTHIHPKNKTHSKVKRI